MYGSLGTEAILLILFQPEYLIQSNHEEISIAHFPISTKAYFTSLT